MSINGPGYPLKVGCVSVLLILVVSACTRHSVVPRSEYSTLERGGGQRYQITTTDGRSFIFSDFTVTPDAIVVHDREGSEDAASNEDVAVPMEEIESVRRISPAGHAKAFITGIVLVGALAALGYWVIESAAHSSW